MLSKKGKEKNKDELNNLVMQAHTTTFLCTLLCMCLCACVLFFFLLLYSCSFTSFLLPFLAFFLYCFRHYLCFSNSFTALFKISVQATLHIIFVCTIIGTFTNEMGWCERKREREKVRKKATGEERVTIPLCH